MAGTKIAKNYVYSKSVEDVVDHKLNLFFITNKYIFDQEILEVKKSRNIKHSNILSNKTYLNVYLA